MKRRGIHVSAWTVNDASVIEELYRLGVDSVITDYPSMALPLVAALAR
jgi:glycerophosphoryl diester phosphodiesterase